MTSTPSTRHGGPLLLLLCLGLLALPGCGWLFTAPAENPSYEQQQLLDQARQYKEQGLLDSALAAFELVLEENPKLVAAHVGVGDVYQVRGNYEAAAEKYRTAQQIEPGAFEPTYKLGLMYHLMQRVRDAIREYLAALAIDPKSYQANLNLATAYLQINEPQLGLPYAEVAVRIRPDAQAAHVNLGSIYSALGQHQLAVEEYRAAAELGDLEPQIALNLVDALLKSGHYQRALNTLSVLAAREPTALVYERMGYARFKLGDYEKSLERYRQALSIEPNDPASLNGVGVNLMTMYLRGRREDQSLRDEAISAWQRSLRVKPDQQRIVDLIARYRKL